MTTETVLLPIEERRRIFKEWIAALRSGKYKQGRAKLKQRDVAGEQTYCCLGVLCEVAGLEEAPDKDCPWTSFKYKDSFSVGGLPTTFAKAIGMGTLGDAFDGPEFLDGGSARDVPGKEPLFRLNDREVDRLNFEQIADRLEANPSVYLQHFSVE